MLIVGLSFVVLAPGARGDDAASAAPVPAAKSSVEAGRGAGKADQSSAAFVVAPQARGSVKRKAAPRSGSGRAMGASREAGPR